MIDYVWLIPLFPLIGFLINGLFGRKLGEKTIGFIASAMVGLSFVTAISIFFHLLGLSPPAETGTV